MTRTVEASENMREELLSPQTLSWWSSLDYHTVITIALRETKVVSALKAMYLQTQTGRWKVKKSQTGRLKELGVQRKQEISFVISKQLFYIPDENLVDLKTNVLWNKLKNDIHFQTSRNSSKTLETKQDLKISKVTNANECCKRRGKDQELVSLPRSRG